MLSYDATSLRYFVTGDQWRVKYDRVTSCRLHLWFLSDSHFIRICTQLALVPDQGWKMASKKPRFFKQKP